MAITSAVKGLLGTIAADRGQNTYTGTTLTLNKFSGTASISSGMQTLTGTLTPTAGTMAAGGKVTLTSDVSGSAGIAQGSDAPYRK